MLRLTLALAVGAYGLVSTEDLQTENLFSLNVDQDSLEFRAIEKMFNDENADFAESLDEAKEERRRERMIHTKESIEEATPSEGQNSTEGVKTCSSEMCTGSKNTAEIQEEDAEEDDFEEDEKVAAAEPQAQQPVRPTPMINYEVDAERTEYEVCNLFCQADAPESNTFLTPEEFCELLPGDKCEPIPLELRKRMGVKDDEHGFMCTTTMDDPTGGMFSTSTIEREFFVKTRFVEDPELEARVKAQEKADQEAAEKASAGAMPEEDAMSSISGIASLAWGHTKTGLKAVQTGYFFIRDPIRDAVMTVWEHANEVVEKFQGEPEPAEGQQGHETEESVLRKEEALARQKAEEMEKQMKQSQPPTKGKIAKAVITEAYDLQILKRDEDDKAKYAHLSPEQIKTARWNDFVDRWGSFCTTHCKADEHWPKFITPKHRREWMDETSKTQTLVPKDLSKVRLTQREFCGNKIQNKMWKEFMNPANSLIMLGMPFIAMF